MLPGARIASLVVAVAMASGASAACAGLLGLDEKQLAPPAACPGDDAGYHDIENEACWSTFAGHGLASGDPLYLGGAFDGRYVYFLANRTGEVVRHDTRLPFGDAAAWSSYDTASLQFGWSLRYVGLVFDGRYLYLVCSGVPTFLIRYDTTQEFKHAASWESSAAGGVNVEFQGGTFDGRYVYFAAYGQIGASGKVTRYDTHEPFAKAASWSSFDTMTLPHPLGPVAAAYFGAVFDGRYVYFVPSGNDENVLARYDTQAPFTSAAAWTLFSTKQVDKTADGYSNATFDGRYVTLVPYFATAAILQYDVGQPFTDLGSWKAHVSVPTAGDAGANKPTFGAGAFDGRFVYYVPGIEPGKRLDGLLVRHDGSDPAGFEAGWSSYDTRKKLQAGSFGAAVFDGRYLYLAPVTHGPFARFDAKDVQDQPMLPGYFGSFF